jgi:hypothetical protein
VPMTVMRILTVQIFTWDRLKAAGFLGWQTYQTWMETVL